MMTTFLAVPETAEVKAARVVTVVVVPPDPPEVLKGKVSERYLLPHSETAYPPFKVAYPTVATSLTDARLTRDTEA